MASEKLKLGDTVMLNSGGPIMTVTHADGSDQVQLTWFDKDEKSHSISITSEAVKKVNPDDYL